MYLSTSLLCLPWLKRSNITRASILQSPYNTYNIFYVAGSSDPSLQQICSIMLCHESETHANTQKHLLSQSYLWHEVRWAIWSVSGRNRGAQIPRHFRLQAKVQGDDCRGTVDLSFFCHFALTPSDNLTISPLQLCLHVPVREKKRERQRETDLLGSNVHNGGSRARVECSSHLDSKFSILQMSQP